MRTTLRMFLWTLLLSGLQSSALWAGEKDFKPLFNGKDLSGWVNVNCAPDTFSVKDGKIYCTGKPSGMMRTDKHYENFILELDWMHIKPKGNAGLFIWSDANAAKGVPYPRSIEVQIMDGVEKRDEKGRLLYTSQGDIFSIHGAKMKPDRPHPAGWERCLPSEDRTKPAGQWNHYRLVCKDGSIKLAINGKVVSGCSKATPRKGYICLESEGSPIWFKNIRIKELPSTNPGPKDIATQAKGVSFLNHQNDRSGWKVLDGYRSLGQSSRLVMNADGRGFPPPVN